MIRMRRGATSKMSLNLPCRKKALLKARSKILKFASANGFGAESQDIALAAQEALKNIIQHACPADNRMRLECAAEKDRFVLDIVDKGLGFDVDSVEKEPLTPMAIHGRGIQLMKGLMDKVSIISDGRGTVVRMEKIR